MQAVLALTFATQLQHLLPRYCLLGFTWLSPIWPYLLWGCPWSNTVAKSSNCANVQICKCVNEGHWRAGSYWHAFSSTRSERWHWLPLANQRINWEICNLEVLGNVSTNLLNLQNPHFTMGRRYALQHIVLYNSTYCMYSFLIKNLQRFWTVHILANLDDHDFTSHGYCGDYFWQV